MKRRIVIMVLLTSLIPLVAALAMRPAPPENFDALRLSLGQAPDFVAEYHNLRSDLTDAGYWKTGDYDGRYYHFRDGERLVVGQCGTHSLWIFGNSGFQDPWLPDNLTAATKLSTLVRGYRIVNRSSGGQHIAGQLVWLRETPIQAGDIVIFIDGAMDAPNDVRGLLSQAQAYTERHHASWWHFRQPVIDSAKVAMMPGLSLNVPPDGFVEGSHMNEWGARLEAKQMYDALTIY